MSFSPIQSAILRTLCFHEAWGYLPTLPELVATLDAGDVSLSSREELLAGLSALCTNGVVRQSAGRIGLAAHFDELFLEIQRRDPLQPRKRRRAVRVAKWLARFGGVRFVALANTTALGNARDGGDLDFFVVVRAGSIWATRLLASGPFRLLGLLPTADEVPDAICLSYFIADDGLDLSTHALVGDDPYFRQWFLALVPLFDDGISQEIWDRNANLRRRHPFVSRWIAPPDLRVRLPRARIPLGLFRVFESLARRFQMRWFPAAIRTQMNVDSRVMVNDSVLKFHVQDGREEYRERYRELCASHGIEV